jgi:uncharacterized protein YndB with AHSA1/START domain
MAAEKSSPTPTDTTGREMVISRVIAAPRELVFDAFTDREHISQWWGPNGFRTTTYEKSVRPGGVWRFTMHGPDGVDYPNKIVYIEVLRPERLVYEHSADDDSDENRFVSTITLEAMGDKTKVTLRALFATIEQCEAHTKFGAVEGGNQTLARLDHYLSKQSPT